MNIIEALASAVEEAEDRMFRDEMVTRSLGLLVREKGGAVQFKRSELMDVQGGIQVEIDGDTVTITALEQSEIDQLQSVQ